MTETRIKISSIVENQLPQFVKEEFPLVSEFLSQYYTSLENQGGSIDLLQNIDQYIKVDSLTNLVESTTLSSDVTFFDSTINVTSTAGFPDSYGLILIDSEIITYTSKTSTTFEGCVRGFSGVTAYKPNDELTFSESLSQSHLSGETVQNLSILFLKEFLNKVKKQFTPGFEGRELYTELNERIFIKQSIDFYSSKGTDNSFKILFGALYGQNVEIIRPRDYLIQPSDAQYRITSDLVLQAVEGNPENLVNGTLYQYQNEDETEQLAQGTITKVEEIRRGSESYYLVSLDADYDKDILPIGTVYGQFKIHPKTKIISDTVSASRTLEVDSTVGFPKENGKLRVDLENGSSLDISYTSKTLNQFIGCSGINQDIPQGTHIKLDYFTYGNYNDEKITVRVLGVLADLNIPPNTQFYSKGDVIKIKTLGKDAKDFKSNNWFFNIPVEYSVSNISISDAFDRSYIVNLSEEHSLRVGDSVSLISSSDNESIGNIISFNNTKSITVQFGSEGSTLNINQSYIIRRRISKVDSENYPSVNQYTSNVQNVYSDNDGSLYVSSPSLPTYLNRKIRVNDRSIVFPPNSSTQTVEPDDYSDLSKGTTLNIGRHGFYTGDAIVYKPPTENSLGIAAGVYFIKRISATEVKLAKSRNNIFSEKYISFDATIRNNKFELQEFTYRDLSSKLLESQKLIRKISNPLIDGNTYETEPGTTGIFINGVELLNYKSKDNIFYGPINDIVVSSPGEDYDVSNPPILSIRDPKGFGAKGHCSIIGGLERIDILDPGFDYIEEPKIEIEGGNGFGASAKVNLVSFDYSADFNSISSAELVKLNPINQIGFSTYHKFRDAEEVVYITNGQTSISGLSTNSSYFVSVKDEFTVSIHKSFDDAVSGINTIRLTAYGSGVHAFKSKDKKKKIGSISIENRGQNYQNKLIFAKTSGISTSENTIYIPSHGYSSGEIVVYNATENPAGGLSSSRSYYVTKVDDDKFKLSEIGSSVLGITTTFYYDTKQYVDLTSSGSGSHKFNYPEIKVTLSGRIGVSTISGQNFNATILPVFRGELQSVFVEDGGANYGTEEIINYNRQPFFELGSGSGASVTPIVLNGQIVNVLVNSPGAGYNSIPNIEIFGDGVGAILTPVISNGSLVDVKVIYGGIGYNQINTSIDIVPSGSGAKLEAKIKPWKINLVERLIQNSQITQDDGILSEGLNDNFGIEYTHAYAPRSLRSTVQATRFEDGEIKYVPDLQILDGRELSSDNPINGSGAHSPIIGWAYDGNPIYGPYGYSSKTGGRIKCMRSGYKLRSDLLGLVQAKQRPNYTNGFFIEDYTYVGDGDLDEHNGRFSVTPEYPNGVYAYFTTINPGDPERVDFPFGNYKRPVFPYAVGERYKSAKIDFNFNSDSNQDDIDINVTNWKRNITPYNIKSYDYLFNPNDIKEQNSVVRGVLSGFVNSVVAEDGGEDYQIGDKLVFDSEINYGTRAIVDSIKGKEVNSISVNTSTFNDVELYPFESQFIGFTTIPHNYLNNDLINFTGKFDYNKFGNIRISTNNLVLNSGIGSTEYTGLITYFNVSGNLNYPNIRENDIYKIGEEEIKILNVEQDKSRIRVIRNQNGTLGLTSYAPGSLLVEKTRKFRINFGISTSYGSNINKEIYFNPPESIGLGTVSGVGIVSTIYFSNPGVGETQIAIPTRSIYIKNHNLNSGDSLIYSSNGGDRISVSTDGISSFLLENESIVYATKISNDLIGISTVKIGLGSDGSFVSIGSTLQGSILYFTSVGVGETHSFKTNYDDIMVGNISKNTVTVLTSENHNLSLLDSVNVSVKSGISTTFIVKYNDYNRRLVINPRSFSSIDIINSIIVINNHNLYNGQKVIYTAANPATGLVDNGMYYIVVIDSNKVKLSNTYYQATKSNPDTVNITSSQPGTISPINPPLEFIKDKQIIFDLSDSSLSSLSNAISYSAFDFKFYTDSNFVEEFNKTPFSNVFEVTKTGRVGIDSTANVAITLNQDIPTNLHYKLVPINLDRISKNKKEILIDTEVVGFNKITLTESKYNGNYTVVGLSSTSFNYNIIEIPESVSYSQDIEYFVTKSTSTKGPINQIKVSNKGTGYFSLPENVSVTSNDGKNSLLNVKTLDIGKISGVEIQDIGFDYSIDYSVRPTAKFPSILILEPLSSLDYIGIASIGKNYNSAPSLLIFDGLTGEIVDDVELSYNLGDSRVTIIKNSNLFNHVTPKVLPINNSNGIKISNISFDINTKDVTVTLGSSFSSADDYPFEVGSKVLIEGISVGVGTTGIGYNSSSYNYSLFTLTAVDSNIGGSVGIVTYNLSEYIEDGEIPGNFAEKRSFGRIIPESYLPIFNPVLKKNDFYEGENVYSDSSSGKILKWDANNQNLKVSTVDDFEPDKFIIGETTGTVGIIREVLSVESDYRIDAKSDRRKGWNTETGFLNNDFQRVHDSDYYQYFSYALKTQKDFNTWNNPVSSLNHTAGFKKFGNLIIESEVTNSGISTAQNLGDFSGTADLTRFVDLNCVNDFDLARENNIIIDDKINSNEIYFNSRVIQDYIESIGNKVLVIDDVSGEFNSNPRPTEFSVVDSFDLNSLNFKKYFTLIQDKKFVNEKQFTLVTLLHDNTVGFLNQYGLESISSGHLGFYDFVVSGNSGNLLFYPVKPKFNDYNIEIFSISLTENLTGISDFDLGDSVHIHTQNSTIPDETSAATTIVGIASTYRSTKLLVQISSTDNSYHEVDEVTVIFDGSNVHLQEYGQITTDGFTDKSSAGFGTYYAYFDGSNVNVDLIPNDTTSKDYNVNTINVSLASTISSGIGTQVVGGSSLNSSAVSIASSSSPTESLIFSYSNSNYNCSYCVIGIEDKTNSEYQTSEFLIATNIFENECYTTEFGLLRTGSYLGDITAEVAGSNTEIYFTPSPNIDVDVKVFAVNVGLSEEPGQFIMENSGIEYDYSEYTGTDNDIKKEFDLKYNNVPIFERIFDASDSGVVSVNSNSIRIPNNFYVTGEEITYSYPQDGVSQPIGIATTFIAGIGTTDKLPSSLYVVRLSDLQIRVAASASEALKPIPNVLDINSVGIGSIHKFTAKNQNNKAIISIDNVIQTPIVSAAITTGLVREISFFDSQIYVEDIQQFYGGDLIKIDDEIVKITSVGVGSTNVLGVVRPWIGTGLSTHSSSSIITKIYGNYNIIGNKIYFSDAPFGEVPFVTSNPRPDELDFVGIKTGSSFSGRIFLRSGILNSDRESYSHNYIFDDISHDFNGTDSTFELKTNGSSVTGISTDNAIVLINDVFQGPDSVFFDSSYNLSENAGITTIKFVGSASSTKYDVNTASIPRGGIIQTVGSIQGFGYQPLVSAGGTAVVSSAGTIQSISIGNSGSGYRPQLQSIINVGVATLSLGTPNIEFIGTASVINGNIVSVAITNPGAGYTSSNPPIVIFDDPLSYSNIPLIYSSQSPAGVGTGAFIDIVVGQGSSVISFEFKNLGYGYKRGDILTIPTSGITGIPTDGSLSYSEFQLLVDTTQNDEFSAWTVGSLQVIDSIDSLFDGTRRIFPITIGGNQTTIRSNTLTKEEIQATLLVFINDILQVPGEGYTFSGGSTLRFSEAPKEGDKSKIIFYAGTANVDTQISDILETIKVGDTVRLIGDTRRTIENGRLVNEIISSDILTTNLYSGPGISEDEDLLRPITWCRQTEDLVINGQQVGKDRVLYEPYIQPSTNIIANVGVGSTVIFVESVKAFFDSEKEYTHDGTNEKPQNKISIISQDSLIPAFAEAVVSSSGTVSSITISNGGLGYIEAPSVIIAGPIGFGTTTSQNTARANATIANGVVTGIAVTLGGFGYSQSKPPIVLVESPSANYESIDSVSYEGDFGIITGVQTTSVGAATTGIIFDLFVPQDSILRDTDIVKVGIATTGVSGIQTGYYFTVNKSNIGAGLTSLNEFGAVVGVGTTFIDNIYQVASVSIAQTSVPGIGITYVTKVIVSVSGYNGLSGVGFSNFYGEYSWGRILTPIRSNPKEFTSYANVGGITTSPIVQRFNRLKYLNYNT
jgi:hypothetical protein